MNLVRLAFGVLVGVGVGLTATADEPEDRMAIMTAVQALFDAMAERDGPGAAAVLLPEGRFVMVERTDGTVTTTAIDHRDFVERVTESEVPLIERAWDPEVRVDGDIASYRARYDFHSGGTYSHCGVDLFTLVRADDGWRISGGTFTREASCADNPLPGL